MPTNQRGFSPFIGLIIAGVLVMVIILVVSLVLQAGKQNQAVSQTPVAAMQTMTPTARPIASRSPVAKTLAPSPTATAAATVKLSVANLTATYPESWQEIVGNSATDVALLTFYMNPPAKFPKVDIEVKNTPSALTTWQTDYANLQYQATSWQVGAITGTVYRGTLETNPIENETAYLFTDKAKQTYLISCMTASDSPYAPGDDQLVAFLNSFSFKSSLF